LKARGGGSMIVTPGPVRFAFLAASLIAAGLAGAEPENLEICSSCHGEDGTGAGYDNVPIIAGTPASHLEEAMFAYKDGARRCVEEQLMCEVIDELTDAEITEFADYYGAMQRAPSGEDFDLTLALNGGQIHEQLCAQCHVYPEDEDVGSALGIPLHAQRSDYLRLAFDAYRNGDRSTLIPAMADNLKLLDDDDIEALIHYYVSYRR
jgi:cytochrome c553